MKKSFILSLCLSIAGLLTALYFIPTITGKIPTHWNASGQIDGYGSRFMLLLFPTISAGISLLMFYLPKLDPKGDNIKKSGALLPVLMVFLTVVMLSIEVVTICAVKQISIININVILPVLLGVMFIALGAFLPGIKPNYTVGIRTPWTLHSETVWTKTHKASGVWFMLSGALFIVGVFLPSPVNFALPLAFMLVAVIGITVYSYVLFKQEK